MIAWYVLLKQEIKNMYFAIPKRIRTELKREVPNDVVPIDSVAGRLNDCDPVLFSSRSPCPV